ncbi:MAG: hypothetical protein Q7S57_00045 [bacterium]|nr:hypothetical protein [bacterium]
MNKKLCLEMALCIVAGVLVGLCLAFRYHINPHLASTTGGLVGAFCFRPSEAVSFLRDVFRAGCEFFCFHGKAIGRVALIVTTLGLSLVFHYSLAVYIENHLPGAYSSTGQTVLFLYAAGLVFSVTFWANVFQDRKEESVSWSMPTMSRIIAFHVKHRLNVFPGWKRGVCVVFALLVIFFLPLSLVLFIWLCFFWAIDLLLTIAMFMFFTPRLAVAVGAFAGTLAGCCFCEELWIALLFGCVVGVPVGLGFHWLRWYLSSTEDRKVWSTVTV